MSQLMTSTAEVAVQVSSGEHVLAGTLAVPPGGGARPPALLLPGSGPVDRNSDHKRRRLGITAQLSSALTHAGVVTLRYDKRGVGESAGSWRSTGLYDNVEDAAAVLDALVQREEVDAARVFLVGHSEGSLLASALVARGAHAAGVVLLSASATPGEQLLLWQAAQMASTLPTPVRTLLRLLRTDLVARVAKNHAKIKATTTDTTRIGAVKMNARCAREFMAHDPRQDLAHLHLPVLAITGSKDLQVDPGDLEEIADLVPGPVETHEVADVSHILRAQEGRPSLSRYKKDITRPVDARVLDLIVSWLGRHS